MVVGDSEFGSVKVLRQLQIWHWQYVLRQKSNNLVQLPQQARWQPFGEVIEHVGQKLWWSQAKLTAQYAYSVNLLAVWQPGEKGPWLLATNLSSMAAALRAYRRRAWIEEMFGDMKSNGFDLESTHLHSFIRLSRLTLAVILLYDWLATTGIKAIKAGFRRLVDRSDRRDLSIFQIGWRLINRRLVNQQSVSIRLCPFSLSKVSGSEWLMQAMKPPASTTQSAPRLRAREGRGEGALYRQHKCIHRLGAPFKCQVLRLESIRC